MRLWPTRRLITPNFPMPSLFLRWSLWQTRAVTLQGIKLSVWNAVGDAPFLFSHRGYLSLRIPFEYLKQLLIAFRRHIYLEIYGWFDFGQCNCPITMILICKYLFWLGIGNSNPFRRVDSQRLHRSEE